MDRQAEPESRLPRLTRTQLLAADESGQPAHDASTRADLVTDLPQSGRNVLAPPKVQAAFAQAQKVMALMAQPKVRAVQVRAAEHGCEQRHRPVQAPRRGHVGGRSRPAVRRSPRAARAGPSDPDLPELDDEPPRRLAGPSPRL